MEEKELYECSECKGMITNNGEFYLCSICGLIIDYPLIDGYELESRDLGYERKRKEAREALNGF